MGTAVVGLIVVAVIGLAARSVYRTKKGGGCSCDCSGCDAGKKKSCH